MDSMDEALANGRVTYHTLFKDENQKVELVMAGDNQAIVTLIDLVHHEYYNEEIDYSIFFHFFPWGTDSETVINEMGGMENVVLDGELTDIPAKYYLFPANINGNQGNFVYYQKAP